jgi:hypothetical protein
MGGSMYGYMHFYLGMTMMQVMSFMLGRFTKWQILVPFPTRLARPQETSKRFIEEKNLFPAQESNFGISVQSIASPLCFTSWTLYRGGKSLGTHRTGVSVTLTADMKTMSKWKLLLIPSSRWMCHEWPWSWPQVLLVSNVIWYASRTMAWQLHALRSPKCHWRMTSGLSTSCTIR